MSDSDLHGFCRSQDMVMVKSMLNDNGRNERPSPFAGWTNFIPESEIRRLLQYNVRYYYGGGKPGVLPLKTFSQIFKDLAEKEFDAKIGTNGEAEVL
ncbi:MAG: hypothetical protein ACXAB4_08625, partial [Candidatus Hodarchaeales archaeon]